MVGGNPYRLWARPQARHLPLLVSHLHELLVELLGRSRRLHSGQGDTSGGQSDLPQRKGGELEEAPDHGQCTYRIIACHSKC